MQLGPYSLGQNIAGLAGLTEISQLEYAVLPKTFAREKIFRTADITFLGYPWNLVLGTIDGSIYKLSAQFISDLRDVAMAVFAESFMYCTDQFGKGSVNKDGNVVKWATSFGNIIVDTGSALGQHYVNFQLTSGPLVRSIARLGDGKASPCALVWLAPADTGVGLVWLAAATDNRVSASARYDDTTID